MLLLLHHLRSSAFVTVQTLPTVRVHTLDDSTALMTKKSGTSHRAASRYDLGYCHKFVGRMQLQLVHRYFICRSNLCGYQQLECVGTGIGAPLVISDRGVH